MTLHDKLFTETCVFFTFAVFGLSRFHREKWRVSPSENEVWLGAESNRRHEDFQSSALPTELPSRDVHSSEAPSVGRHYAVNVCRSKQKPVPVKYGTPLRASDS